MRLLIAFSALLLSVGLYGQNDYCMSFDGNDDYIDLGTRQNFLFQDLFSFEAWVKVPLNTTGTNGAIIGALDSYRILIYAGNANNGALYVEFPELNPFSGIDAMGSTDLRDNIWHHLAVTYDGAQVVLYVDGLVEDSSAKTGDISLSESQDPFFIGNSSHVNYEDFHGEISNLGLWNISRSQSDIQQYMFCPLTGSESGLVGYWKFDEGSGLTAFDQTANGNNGEVIGATWSTDVPEQSCLGECTDSLACNYNSEAIDDDGSCDYSCCPGPGCCSIGHYWDWELEQCFDINPTDSNLDGCTDLNDLMNLLGAYGDCGVGETLWQCGDPIEYQGYNYETVQIGEQCWFAENLRAGNYRNGDAIPTPTSFNDWITLSTGARTSYENDVGVSLWHGQLYNWYASMDPRGICPTSWGAPSNGNWQAMETHLGMDDALLETEGWRGSVGTQLKNGGTSEIPWNGLNQVSFNGTPSGFRQLSGGSSGFVGLGSRGEYWTTSAALSNSANKISRSLDTNQESLGMNPNAPNCGFSIRCLKD